MQKRDITPDLVARLLATQCPQWSGLPVTPVALDGWDNTTFRLGDELSVRLPSADVYVAQIEKEHRWLPILAPRLPLQIPIPLVVGQPGEGFPRPWSVYRWIEGDVVAGDELVDDATLARDLARFLAALYAIDGRSGPRAGGHNFFRGGPVATYDAQTRAAIQDLAGQIDTPAASEVWRVALESEWSRPPVWVHGDVAPSNLLVDHGRLRAVIDFGCAGVGDPACDLVMAWTYFSPQGGDVFRRELGLDDDTWARGRGWALWKALVTVAYAERIGVTAAAAARRFGWRGTAHDVIDRVLADHRSLGS